MLKLNVIIQSNIFLYDVTFEWYIYLWTEMQEVQGQEGSGDEDSGPMNLEERTGTSL